MSDSDHVVITGVGSCCSLGCSRSAILQAMLAGKVAIDHAPALERSHGEEVMAAQAAEGEPEFGASRFRGELLVERVVRAALAEAGPFPTTELRSEAIFGTTLGGLRHLGYALRNDDIDGYRHTTTATFTALSVST